MTQRIVHLSDLMKDKRVESFVYSFKPPKIGWLIGTHGNFSTRKAIDNLVHALEEKTGGSCFFDPPLPVEPFLHSDAVSNIHIITNEDNLTMFLLSLE